MATRSKGPSPMTWYAMLTSPLRAYFVSASTTIVSRPLGLACTEICHSRAVDHFPRFVARPEVSEEAVALLVRELSVEHLAIRRRIRVRRAVQEPIERRRLVPRQDADLDSRLEQHVGARESGVVCEFEQVTLVEVEHRRRVAGQRVEAVAKPFRERPHLAHLDPAEDAVRLRVAEAVDRLEHREPAAGTEHPEELRERAGLLVDVDNHRARRDDVDRPVGDRAQVLRGGEHELAARVAVRQLARDVEQVLRNIAEDHTAGAAFQRAEGDQPVAAAHVEERLTLPQLRTVEHAVAHLLQPGENPGGRALVAAEAAVEDESLVKTYPGGVRALDGLTFSVPDGTVFGLLGPNGAGKTTAVKILTTLSRADSGTARVAGFDVLGDAAEVRRLIGVVQQKHAVDPALTGRENLRLQGRVFNMRRGDLEARVQDLLDQFGLTDAGDRVTRGYSGGMQRRLDIAMALVHRPRVLFLDEPTTGLDPEVRVAMWREIERLRGDEGLTILLTTHYLEEADVLASNLAIVDKGKVVAAGEPEALKGELLGDSVVVELAGTPDGAVAALTALDGIRDVQLDGRTLRTRTDDGARAVPVMLQALESRGLAVESVTVARPSLDDVYLQYTGRAFAEADAEGAKQ